MANLVLTLLKRTNPAADEGSEEIVREQALLQKILQSLMYDLQLRKSVSRIVFEVQFGCGRLDPELGQVESIMALNALHVEEGLLPFLASVQASDPGKDGTRPRGDAGRTTGGHHLRVTTRDCMFPEVEVLRPGFDSRPETEISLGKRAKSRQGDEGISREVVRLQAEEV